MRSPISSSALHSAVLASLALGAASGVSLGQAFSVFPAADDALPSVTLTPPEGEYFRINNIYGNLGIIAAADPITSLPLSNTTDDNNYLNRLGQFTFANDYPILNVRLTLAVNSAFTSAGTPSVIISPGTNDGAPENRFSFLTQDFALLFVGQSGSSFMIAKNSAFDTSSITDEDNFILRTNPGDLSTSLEYCVRGSEEYTLDGPVLKDNQVGSLEWTGGFVNDPTWDPRDPTVGGSAGDNLDDTFPVAADVTPENLPFYVERGVDFSKGTPLYPGGAAERTWNVYLFTTGIVLGGGQLNLSEITVTLAVPEASNAVAAGVAVIFIAGVLKSRRQT